MAAWEDKKEAIKIPSPSRRHCPFVSEPDDDCFSSGTTSQSAAAAIRLCGGNFQACEIYRRKGGGGVNF